MEIGKNWITKIMAVTFFHLSWWWHIGKVNVINAITRFAKKCINAHKQREREKMFVMSVNVDKCVGKKKCMPTL